MKFYRPSLLFLTGMFFFVSTGWAGQVDFGEQTNNGSQIFWLSNNKIKYSLFFEEGKLLSDKIEAHPQWVSQFASQPFNLETDADFAVDVIWTGWRAPGNANNAENPALFSKQNFQLVQHKIQELLNGSKELNLFFKAKDSSIELRITYQLEEDAFYARKRIAVRDLKMRRHFLQWMWPRCSQVFEVFSVCKYGGFGQPVAFLTGKGGAFFGLEYPSSENSLRLVDKKKMKLLCGQEMGEHIGDSWIESEWVVEGLSPNRYIKFWFDKYLDRIRVVPLRPYLLYNTWYDVRAPEIVKNPAHIMNEKNLLRIVDLFKKEMVEKRGIYLDTFVLDDGWDIYKSDWILRKEQFPRGLVPVKEALKGIKADLGIWLGPIGGYSNRDWRVKWMRDHGYEAVGNQLCLAGEHYHKLFKKRVVDFVRNDGVSYYKWDGVQYSCSEPDHGHAVGIYSRRAVMEAVIDLCRSVRAENPSIFLNITSGTWLSPWWVKYANMIWMQGHDYGYSNVPSISKRDGAITYRDFVLYEDYGKNNFWFPIANLMTHGIIKGHLQKLGGEAEPLNKFMDNALLYFARGVSMWELYISPDLLSDAEWNALTGCIQWAKDRFEVLRSSEMIGGDPGERNAYGYVHFSGKKGIIAVRNPFIEPQTLKVELKPFWGLDPDASSLVLERIYPTRWISPKLFKAGSFMELPLQGYETALYEIFPIEEAVEPLLAGALFDVMQRTENDYVMKIYEEGKGACLLNPENIRGIKHLGDTLDPHKFSIPFKKMKEPVSHSSVQLVPGEKQTEINIQFNLSETAKRATLAVLLESTGIAQDSNDPKVTIALNGKETMAMVEKQKGRWGWYKLDILPGRHTSKITIASEQCEQKWTGKVSVWLIYLQKLKGTEVSFDLAQGLLKQRPMPPRPWAAGELCTNVKLGEVEVVK